MLLHPNLTVLSFRTPIPHVSYKVLFSPFCVYVCVCFSFDIFFGLPSSSLILSSVKHIQWIFNFSHCTYSVQFSHSVVSNSLRPHESQHAKLPLSITNSQSSPRLMSIEWVIPSSHLVLISMYLSISTSVCNYRSRMDPLFNFIHPDY